MTRKDTKDWLVQYDTMGFDPLDADKWLIMRAYSDGTDIEWSRKGEDVWHSASDPAWQWGVCDYRVKPQPSFAPFKDAREFMEGLISHSKGAVIKDTRDSLYELILLDFTDNTFRIAKRPIRDGSEEWHSLASLLSNFTFTDGTPCGKPNTND